MVDKLKEAKPGALIVSYAFALPEWELIKKEQGILFEINKYNKAEQKREQELIEKTLARIKAAKKTKLLSEKEFFG